MDRITEATSYIQEQDSSSGNICLCTESLCLSYGTRAALENVNLRIPSRAVTAIIGPSGSGKSSFLCCLNRMTDLCCSTTIEGSVRLGEHDIHRDLGKNPIALRRRVGMVFQHPNPFPFSIWKNLALPLKHHGVRNKQELSSVIEQALRRVGLWEEVSDRLRDSALTLSGGQQQRLCIARALVLEPEVLLMDEPCSSLDPLSTKCIETLIGQLKNSYTIVVVTHDLAQARRVADHVALFWNADGVGRLIEQGPAARVFQHPEHELTTSYLEGQL
ncbi:MAG: phosphate ABC transporter ATP-binding protein [Candidatus Thiodiazotropha sp. (ex Dulcina madagascariensis)]|nr:phosphate ABC transporter ATP-binding protein [Candidatus Thiodiazotropha sp. (ex Dulcina madagascariensis)]